MTLQEGRFTAESPSEVAQGWTVERLTQPSRLFGANGLRTGPDGRIYVAQVTGSQISAVDIGTGQVETISAKGGDIVAPDDVAFDSRGNLYATEVMDGRVSVRGVDGSTRVLRDDLPWPTASPCMRIGCSSANAGKVAGYWNSIAVAASRGCCWRTCRRRMRWRSAPTACCISR